MWTQTVQKRTNPVARIPETGQFLIKIDGDGQCSQGCSFHPEPARRPHPHQKPEVSESHSQCYHSAPAIRSNQVSTFRLQSIKGKFVSLHFPTIQNVSLWLAKCEHEHLIVSPQESSWQGRFSTYQSMNTRFVD